MSNIEVHIYYPFISDSVRRPGCRFDELKTAIKL